MILVEIRLKGSGKRIVGAVDDSTAITEPTHAWVPFYIKNKEGWHQCSLLVSEVCMFREVGVADDKAVKGES